MQRLLRIALFLIVTLLSLETLFWVLDNVARWEWVETFVTTHPYLDIVLHSPLMAFVLLWAILAVRWGEKRLKMPEFIVEFSRIDAIPQLSAITAEMVIENQVGTGFLMNSISHAVKGIPLHHPAPPGFHLCPSGGTFEIIKGLVASNFFAL